MPPRNSGAQKKQTPKMSFIHKPKVITVITQEPERQRQKW